MFFWPLGPTGNLLLVRGKKKLDFTDVEELYLLSPQAPLWRVAGLLYLYTDVECNFLHGHNNA
jgi:hypothetical protein